MIGPKLVPTRELDIGLIPMNQTFLLIMALVCLLADASWADESLPMQHWQITLGEVYKVNSFFCTSKEGVDKLIEARKTHYEAPSLPFRFPEECKLAQFAFYPLRVTDIERSYFVAQRDSRSSMYCRNSKGKVYKCSFIRFTSRYIFGQLLMDTRALDVYVEAPSSITVTASEP
jgi:hypothetical protein